jgi:2-polyprenyl-3-methyl-5-hydroxy-6-metoxy-1,4-benzoquinol methylase
MTNAHETRLARSWEDNADAWTAAVREGAIASRGAGTDAAIVAACAAALPSLDDAPVLDVGCGEGWLARALAAHGARVLGVDASAPLVAAARAAAPEASAEADGASGRSRMRFEVATYETLVADPTCAAGPFALVVLNFALLAEDAAPTLSACARRLAPGGRVIVQTVHPWAVVGDGPYASGWREETFATFAVPFPATMPWFFRTLADWHAMLDAAGLRLVRLHEPLHPETRRPLSLLLVTEPIGTR